MRFFGFSLTVALAAITLGSAPLAAQANSKYRITNSALGTGYSLDVGDALTPGIMAGMMLPTGQASGQFWNFEAPFVFDNRIKLSNIFKGPTECLNVAGDGALYMSPCNSEIGQRWMMQEVPGIGVRFTNEFKPGQCLGALRSNVSNQIFVPLMQSCTGGNDQVWIVTHTGRF